MAYQPAPHVGAGRPQLEPVRLGIRDRAPHQPIRYTPAPGGFGRLHMQQIQDAIRSLLVQQLRFALGKSDEETGLRRILLDVHWALGEWYGSDERSMS